MFLCLISGSLDGVGQWDGRLSAVVNNDLGVYGAVL